MIKNNWLEKILKECGEQKQKELHELRGEPPKFTFRIESGKESFGFRIDLSELIDKFYTPIKLLERAQSGISNLLTALNLNFEMNYVVKGLSGEYIVPFYLKDEERQVIFTPALFPCILEAFGFPSPQSYNAFLPFLTLEFFKYIDIMNAQEKPTIMAFYGITNFTEVANVNFLEFFEATLKDKGITPSKGDIQKSMKNEGIYGIDIKNMFESYGIPRIDIKLKDALRMSILSPDISENKRELVGYCVELDLPRFLNPTILDYSLYATHKYGEIKPETLGDFITKGKSLGHTPSSSKRLPDITPKKAEKDPFDLMEYLKQEEMVVEARGKYTLTPEGLRLTEMEVYGKPPESTLRKVWNIIMNAKRLIPFLKFIQ
ncbi:MAG: hypothetical protein SCAL_000575 [Candidatus Syntrophoarchaeum caldarius]|uniref:Uncharacterized protein n=1 Tax=Candidatus Syntropharchaeum caldarium TaxID=1838285 RepID=A0A1F2PA61_9EURY|nr:MAG: hypothetical protein SCAL_000575 [Candidatus Syntrophoarchaeum caldarius]